MRTRFFYTGIFFVLIGLVFLIVSSYLQSMELKLVDQMSNSWEISADIEEKNAYILDILPSNQWRDDYTDGLYDTPQPVDVVITSPSGGETKLQAFFYARLPSSPYRYGGSLIVVYVEYSSVDSNGLQVDGYSRVRFTTKQRGNYTARIIEQTVNWTSGPPREIRLYVEVFEAQNLRGFFLQSGGILSIVGVVVSVYGLKAAKKLRSRQKKKFK